MAEDWKRRLQLVEADILADFADLCEREHLRYYLIAGTLLGAVRHKGFIPWDDDVDVVMPRADYERFKAVAPAAMDASYYIQAPENTPHYVSDIIKVRKKNTLYHSSWSERYNLPCYGIWLDIFPLDDVPRQESAAQRLIGWTLQKPLKRVFNWYDQSRAKKKRSRKGRVFLWAARLLPMGFYDGLRDRLMRRYDRRDCDYWVNYTSQYGYKKQTIEKSRYEPASSVEFEGRTYRAPGDSAYILTRLYGPNYMQLPPVEKRRTHNPVRLSFDTEGPDETI